MTNTDKAPQPAQPQPYETRDIWEAVYIAASGFPNAQARLETEGRAVFVFPADAASFGQSFRNGNPPVPVHSARAAHSMLKDMIFELKRHGHA